jgi:glutamyl-tRNA synthetase
MTETGPVRTRIAPSPTGEPHIGNMYVALLNWAFARQAGGQFLVRIEDTDRTRFVAGAEEMILASLRWLGLAYDEGPDCGGPFGPYRQSERLPIYHEHVDRLLAAGRAYRCFCTPERLKEIRKQATGQATGYDRKCRGLDAAESARRAAAGEPHTVRLAVPLEGETRFTDGLRGEITIENRAIDDQVLLKSDGYPTYHLAVVVDDRLMGITHVIRAEEWIVSTPKHVLLYEAFGWPLPKFYHAPLLRNPDRSKLSKRKNPTNVLWYRREGFLPEAVVNYLGLLGHSMPDQREVFTLEEFRREFSWTRVNTSGPIFDMEKFEWLNGMWIRRLPVEELAARLRAEGFWPEAQPTPAVAKSPLAEAGRATAIVRLMQERLKRLKDFPDGVAFFAARLAYDAALLVPDKKGKPTRSAAETRAALERLKEVYAAFPSEPDAEASGSPLSGSWKAHALEAAGRKAAEDLGWKPGDLFTPLRVAVTMRRVSTPLFETMEILGREECLARIDAAIAKAQTIA